MDFKIEGMDELLNNIKKLDKEMDKQINKALENVGEFVRQDAFNKTPVKGGISADGRYVSESETADPSRAGAVRKSLKYMVSKYNSEVFVYTNNIIAKPLELGTSREQAKPFLRPAIDENHEKIKQIFAETLKEALKQRW